MRFVVHSLLQFKILMLAMTAATTAADADRLKPVAQLRKYADGPLSVADFTGKPPEKSPINLGIEMVANTECEVRYEYRAAIEQQARDRRTARITSFTCIAVVEPTKCWNTWPQSRRVLDHEQGHFDLAELAARRAQQHFAGLMRDRKAAASGRDRRAAERRLDVEIKQAMEEVYDWLSKAQKTYDEETRHGTAFLAQRKHRAWQRAELEKTATAK